MKLATSNTKKGLEKLINEFYCSQNYRIGEDNLLYNEKLSSERLEKVNNTVKVEQVLGGWLFSKR